MKTSGYYCAIVDFENFISEMTVSFSNLKPKLEDEVKPRRISRFSSNPIPIEAVQKLNLLERNLLVLSSCWNLCLYHRATQATVINIPEEATELFFAWFKGRVDAHVTKY